MTPLAVAQGAGSPLSPPEAMWPAERRARVVHVVGRVTDEVFGFLGPTTHALARHGLDQLVVMIDDPRHRHHLANLHDSAELVLAPYRRNPAAQWRDMLQACVQAFGSGPLHAVHLHGVLPCVVGAIAKRGVDAPVPVFFSPHGSRALNAIRSLGKLLLWIAQPLMRRARAGAIVNLPQEAQDFRRWESVELVESPVDNTFFRTGRSEARHPLVVTCGRGDSPRAAEAFAQLAVLLGGEALRLSFNWIGDADAVSRVRLTAANVGIFEAPRVADVARRLAGGWIYVAVNRPRGFPLLLVEAMAAGMPCVAIDCAEHRGVIEHGVNGFLCASAREMLVCIATLIDDAQLRVDIGQAARSEAHRRFSESGFNDRLLAAYAVAAEQGVRA